MIIRTIKGVIVLLMVYASIEAYAEKVDSWIQCHEYVQGCACKWVSGRKTANCVNSSFTDIPLGLSDEIESLALYDSVINVVRSYTFKQAGLVNLKKISMRHCRIREIEKNAFVGLAVVTEIDLTGNQIRKLDPSLFVPTEKLRYVYLNNNSIEKLEDGLFVELKFLHTVELEDNQISHIGNKSFENNPLLKNIKLNGNQLSFLNKSIFEFGGWLQSLELKNNPWRCDCHLRDFMMWYTERLYTDPTTCLEPEYLANTPWKQIKPDELFCKPGIVWSTSDTVFEGSTDHLTLACKIISDPKTEAYWMFNSKPLRNQTTNERISTGQNHKYIINFQSEGSALWVNVTILRMNNQDQGTYTCTARNLLGLSERNVTLREQDVNLVQMFGFTRSNVTDIRVLLLRAKKN